MKLFAATSSANAMIRRMPGRTLASVTSLKASSQTLLRLAADHLALVGERLDKHVAVG